MKQFATAWIYDDRQILCYAWKSDTHGHFVVHHLSQVEDSRVHFTLSFKDETKLNDYFDAIKNGEVKEKIENILDGMLERKAKHFAEYIKETDGADDL